MALPVALTCGEPAGVGPEIAAEAWRRLGDGPEFFWIGDPAHLPDGASVTEISDPLETEDAFAHGLPVLRHGFDGPAAHGMPNPDHAQSVIDVIARAVELVREGRAAALCTAPVSKKALQDGAGFAHPGHTEFLAELAGCGRAVMMLACPGLRVVPVTVHAPLRDVPSLLTGPLLEETLRITHAALKRDFGISDPRIDVAGLNPHAGEGGALGREEIEVIAPVIKRLRDEGMDVNGPFPADSMFHAEARETCDAAVAMYHDQALLPLKTLDFHRGVNVTLGLPFARTSPDHGTAMDISGRGIARPDSLVEALKMAAAIAEARSGDG